MKMRKIPQKQLSSECWFVQMRGLSECDTCPLKDTDECGGENIRKTGKNSLGYTVPVGEEMVG